MRKNKLMDAVKKQMDKRNAAIKARANKWKVKHSKGLVAPRRVLAPLSVGQVVVRKGVPYKLKERIDSSYHNWGRTSWVWAVQKQINGKWVAGGIFNESTIKNWVNPK